MRPRAQAVGIRDWATAALVGAVMLGLTCPLHGTAQEAASQAGPRSVMPVGEELALARSAAPASVSDEATVLLWDGADYAVGQGGSNGVTCYVSRAWPESLEPHCFDEEGARTIMKIHIHKVRRRHEGAREPVIEAEVAEGLRSGSFRLPRRPALSYMMSAAQRLFSSDGRLVGPWRPHVMVYYPYLDPEALGLGPTPAPDAGIVTGAGTPLSSLMIIVPEFVPVAVGEPSGDRRDGA